MGIGDVVGIVWFFKKTKEKKRTANGPDPDADYADEDDEDYGAGSEASNEDPYEDEILNDDEDSTVDEEDA